MVDNDNIDFDDLNNEEDLLDFFAKNPLLKLAKDTCKDENEIVEKHVEEILELIRHKVESKEISIKTSTLILSKALGYVAQGFMKNEEEFVSEKEMSNSLIINNVYPALGSYAHNEEANTTGPVEFKGEFDENNFNYKRLVLLAVSLVEYSNWKIHLSQASKVLSKMAKSESETE